MQFVEVRTPVEYKNNQIKSFKILHQLSKKGSGAFKEMRNDYHLSKWDEELKKLDLQK